MAAELEPTEYTQHLIDIDEFRESGLLFEVNRQFFHPLGLALAVKWDDESGEKVWTLHGIFETTDPQGYFMDPISAEDVERSREILLIQIAKQTRRQNELGYPGGIQPLPLDLT